MTENHRPRRDLMGESARADFAAEIERLRSTGAGGPLDKPIAAAGIAAALVGFVTCLVAYDQAVGFDDVRDQMESLILAVFGVGLVVFGSVLYLRSSVTRFLRFWLLRVIYEQRDLAGRADVSLGDTRETDDDHGDGAEDQPRISSAVRSSRA
jgi:hypothetical protein